MSRPADDSKILQSFRFSGQSSGAVRALRGFKKSHHSVPDVVNSATEAFLAKLAADELSEEAERMFQRAKELLHYKRKEITIDLSSGTAVLSAKDFVYEIVYSLSEDDPTQYAVSRGLQSVKRADFLLLPECDALFAGIFNSVVFVLTKGAPVESVIDAIENLNTEDSELRVTYPSDCSHCQISVAGVEAEVRFDGGELAMVFPRTGTPRELWEGFIAVRSVFGLSKDKVLSGLVAR